LESLVCVFAKYYTKIFIQYWSNASIAGNNTFVYNLIDSNIFRRLQLFLKYIVTPFHFKLLTVYTFEHFPKINPSSIQIMQTIEEFVRVRPSKQSNRLVLSTFFLSKSFSSYWTKINFWDLLKFVMASFQYSTV